MTLETLETGGIGHLELDFTDKVRDDKNPDFPRLTLPVGLPPILDIIEQLVETCIIDPSYLPLHKYISPRLLPRQHNYDSLFTLDSNSSNTLPEFRIERDAENESRFYEVLSRTVSAAKDQSETEKEFPISTNEARAQDFHLTTVPPGFQNGMTFDEEKKEDKPAMTLDDLSDVIVDITDLFHVDVQTSSAETACSFIAEIDDADLFGAFDLTEIGEQLMSVNESLTNEQMDSSISQQSKKKQIQTCLLRNTSLSEPKQWAVQLDPNETLDNFRERIPNMAFEWPFELDVFQKQAILCLEENKSVLVAAHTSAGKTVVAEYAIALSLKHATRTIYTSPVKALSNQKYRELTVTFDDVGLVTGDIQINDTASCLIVTTEILRMMLYDGSEILRELEWVIIDEVHYIDDAARGVVWEEVLILLPDHVKLVLLSATVPNTMELAEWVGKLKKNPVYVITTKERPVPLTHYLYTGYSTPSSKGLFLFCNEQGQFLDQEYARAVNSLKNYQSNLSSNERDKNLWTAIVQMLYKEDKLPAVSFSFSKKKINKNCKYFKNTVLTSPTEKAEIKVFFTKCINKLNDEDRRLNQIQQFKNLLTRGFGVHHSGILPILRELVEILFQKGLIKVLFATETFAMGVNMPAKTVIFDDVIKHDGKSFRPLHTGEYVQMSGRAGRRGLDSVGSIIILCKADAPNKGDLHRMVLGKPTSLESRFRLSYSMILHLLKVEQLQVQDMMKRSFSTFNNKKESAEMMEKIKVQLSTLKKVDCFLCSLDLSSYYDSCKEFYRLLGNIQSAIINHPSNLVVPGRVIMVKGPGSQAVLGVVLKILAENAPPQFHTLLLCDPFKEETESGIHPVQMNDNYLYVPQEVQMTMLIVNAEQIIRVTKNILHINSSEVMTFIEILKLGKRRIKHIPPCIEYLIKNLMFLSVANPTGLIGYHPILDLHIQNIELEENCKALTLLFTSFSEKFDCIRCPEFIQHFYAHDSNINIRERHKELQHLLSDEYLTLLPEYQQMNTVLKNLNYINVQERVELKGRVACYFSKHEVLLTEVIMENVFQYTTPAETAALLSCFVLETNKCKQPKLSGNLLEGKKKILSIASYVGNQQREAGMFIPVDVFVNTLHFGMTQVVHSWALGKSFSEVTQLTDLEEGIIVKSIQALHEVLQRVQEAADFIGNTILSEKCKVAQTSIRRDIIFAASLYIQ
ncbi:SKI2 subunit of superkiller complex protein-like isoform X1 [Biomphalaria glabrata]|uniref:SKI2 subunit of superkiller complex protein-like isoform X1 n=1 Tax=Biomphalaria glabrata TaxID=6526 RepID=A0A9W3BB63_BIOGL|nr:SKI2 subunit of superkiller complex protein-like isoform X1 [Biomphalaria glabrata]XP_055896694.1 SKI2 subunit of superkiller complex protein-like isoform X1 [Biomphalaria glabrata]XP_055896695.1 SKI2 subunit of superkiller complex protein-like isoform X1 [Biomphalaria glabrata]XP_055896696.1 SKI2 subunit of superkiller complex protein-like isoform X1 [Biomphalaria glabrata]XP_055896697.1 SKI2 subunit of superkiller complex protein-like isoform X1 [Biomphalaria glabrata]